MAINTVSVESYPLSKKFVEISIAKFTYGHRQGRGHGQGTGIERQNDTDRGKKEPLQGHKRTGTQTDRDTGGQR
jgi:hypothetical protein